MNTKMKHQLNDGDLKSPNHFTAVDHAIVRNAMERLPLLLATIVQMRFWHNRTIVEIAVEIGVPTSIVEEGLTRAFRILRTECLMSPDFSRSLHHVITAARQLRPAA